MALCAASERLVRLIELRAQLRNAAAQEFELGALVIAQFDAPIPSLFGLSHRSVFAVRHPAPARRAPPRSGIERRRESWPVDVSVGRTRPEGPLLQLPAMAHRDRRRLGNLVPESRKVRERLRDDQTVLGGEGLKPGVVRVQVPDRSGSADVNRERALPLVA